MRRRLIVPAALVAASAYVLARRTRRVAVHGIRRARARRATEETLATRWAWPATPASPTEPDAEPVPRAPSWDGDVVEPEWARPPRGRATSSVGPDVSVGSVAPPPPSAPVEADAAPPLGDPEASVEVEVEAPEPATVPAEGQVEVEVAPAAADAEPEGDAPAAAGFTGDASWDDLDSRRETVLDSGPFAFGGWAPQSGSTSLMGVTFARRLEAAPAAARIRLEIRRTQNVPDGGLAVLSDAGFAPDHEGFTLMLAAESAGSFLASGRWELLDGPQP